MLNIIAGSLSTGVPPVVPNSYESIATSIVGSGGSSSITFSSIPSTYAHLQLRQFINGTSSTNFKGQFNGDTGNNYAVHYLLGDGSGVDAGAGTSINYYANGLINSTSNTFAVSIVDILDYSSTSKNTTTRTLTGYDNNGSGLIILYSGLWLNTAAINSITIFPNTGTFNQYSSFALYGIKGA